VTAQGKQCFLKKAPQNFFESGSVVFGTRVATSPNQIQKVFLVLFVHKKNFFGASAK
jgi:hypothetical protein